MRLVATTLSAWHRPNGERLTNPHPDPSWERMSASVFCGPHVRKRCDLAATRESARSLPSGAPTSCRQKMSALMPIAVLKLPS